MILDELIRLNDGRQILLREAASEDLCDSLESLIEYDLPADYCEFLQTHDGQEPGGGSLLGFYRLLSVDEMMDQYEQRSEEYRQGVTAKVVNGVEKTDVRVQPKHPAQ